MDPILVVVSLGSAGLLYVALRYGIVGGGGGVSRRQEQPISYWIGVGVVSLVLVGALVALISTTFFGGTVR